MKCVKIWRHQKDIDKINTEMIAKTIVNDKKEAPYTEVDIKRAKDAILNDKDMTKNHKRIHDWLETLEVIEEPMDVSMEVVYDSMTALLENNRQNDHVSGKVEFVGKSEAIRGGAHKY